MSSSSIEAGNCRGKVRAFWQSVRRHLRAHGVLPLPDQAYEQVEGRLVDVLPAVSAPPHFRESLASNLDLLAQHRRSGVIVRPEPQQRPGLLVGLGIAGLAATAGLVLLIVLLSRGGARGPAPT